MDTTPVEKLPAMRTVLEDPTMKRLLAFEKLGLGVTASTSVYPGIVDKLTPFPMSTFEDPIMPIPLDEPMKMFELPIPPAFPPIQIVLLMFDNEIEFEVPMRMVLDTFELDRPADAPMTIVLQMDFATPPAWKPTNSELEELDIAAAAPIPTAVLPAVLHVAANAGKLPVLFPRYTLLLLSPA